MAINCCTPGIAFNGILISWYLEGLHTCTSTIPNDSLHWPVSPLTHLPTTFWYLLSQDRKCLQLCFCLQRCSNLSRGGQLRTGTDSAGHAAVLAHAHLWNRHKEHIPIPIRHDS